jgi:sugar lactone lactonase YvrE
MCASVPTPPTRPVKRRSSARARQAILTPLVILTALAANVAAGELTLVDGVAHIKNSDTPRDGVETMVLSETWRIGGEDDEIFFGAVTSAAVDDEGNVYLLDMQLSQVQVYSPDGKYLKTLSREGEGPGEVRRPRYLLFMPDGTIGLVQVFPGKIVKIDLEGNPAGMVTPFGNDPTVGGFNNLDKVSFRGGNLVFCGTRMTRLDDGPQRTQYLGSFTEDGTEKVRYLEISTRPDFSQPKFNEKEEYFVNRGRWAVGPDGRVYTAPIRDSYAIHVFRPDGTLDRVIEREMQPWKRTQAEKDRVGEGLVVVINGRRMDIEKKIEDYEPDIARLQVTDDGFLWVLSSRSTREQPEGIFQTYDVFDSEGHFVKQVAVACEGNGQDDGLMMLGDDRVIVIKGMIAALRSMFSRGTEETSDADEQIEPLEVVCYRVASS